MDKLTIGSKVKAVFLSLSKFNSITEGSSRSATSCRGGRSALPDGMEVDEENLKNYVPSALELLRTRSG